MHASQARWLSISTGEGCKAAADLANVVRAERCVGHLAHVLPFIVIWCRQHVIVWGTLQGKPV